MVVKITLIYGQLGNRKKLIKTINKYVLLVFISYFISCYSANVEMALNEILAVAPSIENYTLVTENFTSSLLVRQIVSSVKL